MPDPIPRYLTAADLARRLDVNPSVVYNWLARYPAGTHPLATPPPDATVVSTRIGNLWLESRVPEWREWRRRRDQEIQAWRRASPLQLIGT